MALNLPTNGLDISTKFFHDEEFRVQELLMLVGDGHNLLEISARFEPSVLEAQTELMRTFSEFTMAALFSITNGLAGDRCYYKTKANVFSCVDFTRNNVFVDVVSYTNTISAFEIAAQLDSAILDASTNVQQRSGMKSDRTLRSRVSSLFRKLFSPNSSKDAK